MTRRDVLIFRALAVFTNILLWFGIAGIAYSIIR